jgi:hypothetical protein
MSDLPGVNRALEQEQPREAFDSTPTHGAYWQPDWRDTYLLDSDAIHNHTIPARLDYYDGADNATEFNQYQGVVASDPISYGTKLNIQQLGAPAYMNVMRIPAPEAIDQFDRHPDHGQMQLTGVDSIAAMVPYLELPDYGQGMDPDSMAGFGGRGGLPYHFDYGKQIDQGQAIGPRQIFRSPPTYGDQTAGMYAAGF